MAYYKAINIALGREQFYLGKACCVVRTGSMRQARDSRENILDQRGGRLYWLQLAEEVVDIIR